MVAVTRYDEPRPRLLASPPPQEIVSWTVIPPAYTLSRSVEVLLAVGKTLYVIDPTEAEDRLLDNGPFRHVCISPNGKFVALYTDDGKVWVISSDFQEKFSEYNSRARTIPKDMQWCGNDAVVLAWEDELHMVGPNGASTKYALFGQHHKHCANKSTTGITSTPLSISYPRLMAFAFSRVRFASSCRKFQVSFDTQSILLNLIGTSDVTVDLFKTGSTSPSAVLLDAVEQLEKGSPKADDDLQLIRSNMVDAVDSCIAAAGHEYSVHWQKQLLKAASFGKSVLDLYDSDEFVNMCETLRVLNAVRFYQVGLPLSYEQFFRLGPERLLSRLVSRHEYLLALRLAEFLHLPQDRIYIHWACQKVRMSTDDESVICKTIVKKLNGKRGVSFEEIARAAYEEGRQQLATELLEYETRAGKQVLLLLKMSEDAIALDKAIESGDTDLILYVLVQLRKRLPLASFFRTISSRPTASALVEATASTQDRELLKDLYYQDDRRLDGALLLFADASVQTDAQARLDKLRSASRLIADAKDPAAAFTARSFEESQRLTRLQEALDADADLISQRGSGNATGGEPNTAGFAGLSLHETIYELLRRGHNKRASRVQADFKVVDKTFWWIRLRAHVARRDWREIEDVAKANKKSPIGWEPFFNEVLGAGNAKLASIFVPRCTDLSPQARGEMYTKCGMLVRAGEELAKAKDLTGLEELRAKAAGKDAVEIERMITVLTKKR